MSAKHILYYSPQCNHCNKLLKIINSVNELKVQFEFIDVQNYTPIPSIIKSVPTIMIDKHKIACGRQAFAFIEDERNLYLDAFEHGFGNTQYSYIESDGLCEGTNKFTYLDEGLNEKISNDQTPYITRSQESEANKSELDELIAKRNAEIVQPINRQ